MGDFITQIGFGPFIALVSVVGGLLIPLVAIIGGSWGLPGSLPLAIWAERPSRRLNISHL